MAYAGSRRSSQTGPPPAQPIAAPPARELRPSEKLPVLQSTLPATFVPFNEDITSQPGLTTRDRVQRLNRILESIDHQREGVRENILWLFEREKERIILEATEREQELGLQDASAAIPLAEVEEVIRCMEAPAQPGVDYNITNAPPLDVRRPLAPGLSPRDLAVNHLINLSETGSRELKGYEDHVAGIRSFYEACLQKEVARMEAVGMRPEERSKVAEASM